MKSKYSKSDFRHPDNLLSLFVTTICAGMMAFSVENMSRDSFRTTISVCYASAVSLSAAIIVNAHFHRARIAFPPMARAVCIWVLATYFCMIPMLALGMNALDNSKSYVPPHHGLPLLWLLKLPALLFFGLAFSFIPFLLGIALYGILFGLFSIKDFSKDKRS